MRNQETDWDLNKKIDFVDNINNNKNCNNNNNNNNNNIIIIIMIFIVGKLIAFFTNDFVPNGILAPIWLTSARLHFLKLHRSMRMYIPPDTRHLLQNIR